MSTTTTDAGRLARVPELAAAIVGPDPNLEFVQAAIAQAEADAKELAGELERLEITDQATSLQVTELVSIAKRLGAEVDAARLAITAPLKRRAKAVEDMVRGVSGALAAIVEKGKSAQLAYFQAQARREREAAEAEARRRREEDERFAAERAAAAAEARPVDLATLPKPAPLVPPPAPVRGAKTDYGTTSITTVWSFEVVDAAAVPREFLKIDETKIRDAVRAGARDIAGVRIFQDERLAVRAR